MVTSQFYTLKFIYDVVNKRQRIQKGQSQMDNPEKLAAQGTQEEEKNKTYRQFTKYFVFEEIPFSRTFSLVNRFATFFATLSYFRATVKQHVNDKFQIHVHGTCLDTCNASKAQE